MSEIIQTPRFLVKYWEASTFSKPRTLKHAVFYSEDELLKGLRNIYGNYFIFNIGEQYKSKENFDEIFKQEKIENERQEFERLKQKFGNTNQEPLKSE